MKWPRIKNLDYGLWMSTQQGNVRLCPACFVCIEKNRGCGHMSCSRCGHDFQWDEQGVRLPKSEEEKRQETDFLQQCSLHRIGTKELIELYWPSYATNMRGMITAVEDQLIHVTFDNGDKRRYTLEDYLERQEQAETKPFPKLPDAFPAIPQEEAGSDNVAAAVVVLQPGIDNRGRRNRSSRMNRRISFAP